MHCIIAVGSLSTGSSKTVVVVVDDVGGSACDELFAVASRGARWEVYPGCIGVICVAGEHVIEGAALLRIRGGKVPPN